MTTFRQILMCTLLAALTAVAIFAGLLLHAAAVTVAAVPGEIAATRSALIDQVAALRVDAFTEIDAQANELRGELHGDVRLVNAQASAISGQLDKRVGDSLGRVDVALAAITGLRADLQPALASIAPFADSGRSLMKDGQDSLDDSYLDLRGLLESAEVATTQTAQTMQVVRENTPKFVGHINGIASDFHDATHNLDIKFFHPPPQTKKQKVLGFFSDLKAVLIAALRGGVL
jgi:ABC-type transporter Mla subunit MlaD